MKEHSGSYEEEETINSNPTRQNLSHVSRPLLFTTIGSGGVGITGSGLVQSLIRRGHTKVAAQYIFSLIEENLQHMYSECLGMREKGSSRGPLIRTLKNGNYSLPPEVGGELAWYEEGGENDGAGRKRGVRRFSMTSVEGTVKI